MTRKHAWAVVALVAAAIITLWLMNWRSNKPTEAAIHEIPRAPKEQNQLTSRPVALDARLPEEALSAHPFHVEVVDATGTPVQGAQVMVAMLGAKSEQGPAPFAITDEGGHAQFDFAMHDGVTLLVEASKYRPTTQVVSEAAVRELFQRIILDDLPCLQGHVRTPDGRAAPSDITVIAWIPGYGPTVESILTAPPSVVDQTVFSSSTADNGSFQVFVPKPGIEYVLTAVGKGSMCYERVRAQPEPFQDIGLTVDPIFGCVIQLRTPDNEGFRTSKALFGKGPFWSMEEPTWTSVILDSIESHLLMSQMGDAGVVGAHDQLILYRTSNRNVDPYLLSRSFDYSVHLPGYQAIEVALEVGPLAEGLKQHVLFTRPTSSEWGELEARCSAGLQPAKDTATNRPFSFEDRPVGILELVDSNAEKFTCRVFEALTSVGGVPEGSYKGRVRTIDWRITYPKDDSPPLQVEIRKGETTKLDIQLEGYGGLRLLLTEARGEEYSGGATFEILTDDDRISTFVSFKTPPYEIRPMPEGRYKVRLSGARNRMLDSSTEARFEVQPAAWTDVALPIPE